MQAIQQATAAVTEGIQAELAKVQAAAERKSLNTLGRVLEGVGAAGNLSAWIPLMGTALSDDLALMAGNIMRYRSATSLTTQRMMAVSMTSRLLGGSCQVAGRVLGRDDMQWAGIGLIAFSDVISITDAVGPERMQRWLAWSAKRAVGIKGASQADKTNHSR
jgi:hypothetical protein